jgi:hypothetical protein
MKKNHTITKKPGHFLVMACRKLLSMAQHLSALNLSAKCSRKSIINTSCGSHRMVTSTLPAGGVTSNVFFLGELGC